MRTEQWILRHSRWWHWDSTTPRVSIWSRKTRTCGAKTWNWRNSGPEQWVKEIRGGHFNIPPSLVLKDHFSVESTVAKRVSGLEKVTFSKEIQENPVQVGANEWRIGVEKENTEDSLWKTEKENFEMQHLRLLNENNALQMRLRNLENLFLVNSTLNGGSAFSVKK